MNKHQEYLQAMDIQLWQERDVKSSGQVMTSKNTLKPPVDQSEWQVLQQQVRTCTLCELHKTRKNTVFGEGNIQADLMFVGEAPGANEDLQGKPFVGRAGMLLNEMLHAIGLDRQDVFIANILKCRPPNNRDPLPHEVACCTPYLQKQIITIKPKLIVALGRIAAHFLLETKEPLTRLRGKIHSYGEGEYKTPLLVTYHPAYLLRSPKEKSKAFLDLIKIQNAL